MARLPAAFASQHSSAANICMKEEVAPILLKNKSEWRLIFGLAAALLRVGQGEIGEPAAQGWPMYCIYLSPDWSICTSCLVHLPMIDLLGQSVRVAVRMSGSLCNMVHESFPRTLNALITFVFATIYLLDDFHTLALGEPATGL